MPPGRGRQVQDREHQQSGSKGQHRNRRQRGEQAQPQQHGQTEQLEGEVRHELNRFVQGDGGGCFNTAQVQSAPEKVGLEGFPAEVRTRSEV